jgi:SpoVK/Ycf46/Vps4 family AAA+-type ATPase
MATAEQIKALLKSHAERDDQRFYSVALQVAAREARQGHTKFASDIKELINKRMSSLPVKSTALGTVAFPHKREGDLGELLELTHPSVRISELSLSVEIKNRLDRVILEQRQKDRLNEYGLSPRRKLLFTGCPGTGKTTSAAVLATELKLPLYTIVLDNLITRFMGETASKLRLVFEHIKQTRAVYLFDEFDAIGARRGASNDVGEIRRVLNTFLMLVEQDTSESIILAATNHPELLDKALHRRFDDIVKFEKPEQAQIKSIVQNRLARFDIANVNWSSITECADGLSGAEITRACEDAAKVSILNHSTSISTDLLLTALERRKST